MKNYARTIVTSVDLRDMTFSITAAILIYCFEIVESPIESIRQCEDPIEDRQRRQSPFEIGLDAPGANASIRLVLQAATLFHVSYQKPDIR